MDEAKKPNPLRHAAVLVGGLFVLAVPFGYSVVADYRAYAEYVRTTVREPKAPPPWTTSAYSADQCVNAALDWIEACPGMEDFCRGTLPAFIGACLDSRDRRPWCSSNGDNVKKTSFGYEICEARREAKGAEERTRIRKQRCALALRAVAEYCDELAADAAG